MEVYSFRHLFSGKFFIWPSILIESLVGYCSLGCRPLVLITWNIFCHSLLAWSISIEKSVANLIGSPLYVTSCLSLAALRSSLCLGFCHFNYDVSCSGPLWVPLAWDSLCFMDLCDFFSHQIRKIFHHYFFKQVFYPLLFFLSFWYPYYIDIIMFNVVLHFP